MVAWIIERGLKRNRYTLVKTRMEIIHQQQTAEKCNMLKYV